MKRRRTLVLIVLGSLVGSCFTAPSLPNDPGASMRSGDRIYFALGCEMGNVFELQLGTPPNLFWDVRSDDRSGVPLSGFELGVVPEGFTEVTSLDPGWVDEARVPADGLRGMSLSLTMDPDRNPPKRVGVTVEPDQPEDVWMTNLRGNDGLRTWMEYQRELVEEREASFGGWGCDTESPPPDFP